MNKNKLALLVIGILIAISLVLFMRTPYWTALIKSKGHFIENNKDKRVLYEPGAEKYASQIADFLPNAIKQVENIHSMPFKESFKVYVCNSQKSLGGFVAAKSLYPIRGLVIILHIVYITFAIAIYIGHNDTILIKPSSTS